MPEKGLTSENTAGYRWLRAPIFIGPLVMSAVLFLSGIFSILSPLPLMLAYFRGGRRWAALAAVTNASLVLFAGGSVSAFFFVLFIVAMAGLICELLAHRVSLERTGAYTLLTVTATAVACAFVYARVRHVSPVVEYHRQMSVFLDQVVKSIPPNSSLMNIGDPEEWKQATMQELPPVFAGVYLIMVWLNLVVLVRANPGGLREKLGLDPAFFKKWKAPEYLVWPTIVSGFFLLVEVKWVSDASSVVFRCLMAIYAIQGLSILSHLFDVWGVRGLFRMAGYLAAVFVMMPLVLSLGFFDLWFDFRSKFRQS